MKKSRFTLLSMMVVFSLVLLAAVETLWAVRTYRDMRNGYEHQLRSVLEEVAWKYAVKSIYDGNINIGGVARFAAFASEGLRTAGLTAICRVEVLMLVDGQEEELMTYGETFQGDTMSVDKLVEPLVLRLTVEDPQADILANMRSILILQLLSVVVLTFTFIYLLRTLFRAKSIEDIRRDLTHNITHELKTPVAAAYAATDMLLSNTALAEDSVRRGEYLQMIIAELRHLGDMIEEILRSSTEEYSNSSLRYEECVVGDVVNEVVTSLTLKYASRSIAWHIEVEPDVMVVADRFHLSGVIRALVDNAIKYSPSSAEVTIVANTRGGKTYISVMDRGVGIPRREQRRIFDKFYRVSTGNRHDTKGYGLGLYYVRSIVRHHGGDIELRSESGRGTCFTLHLPRYGK